MDEWHGIEDHLPEATEKALGWSVDEGEVRIVWRGQDNPDGTRPWRIDDDSGCATMKVSHWMRCPAPPAKVGPFLGFVPETYLPTGTVTTPLPSPAAIALMGGIPVSVPETIPLPSATGMLRYPPDGYRSDGGERWPCLCVAACPHDCHGECGCEACHVAYQDFLSCE